MKKQPLRDKGFPHGNPHERSNDDVFLKSDLINAVAWLKQEFYARINKNNSHQTMLNQRSIDNENSVLGWCLGKIDEAFPDTQKEVPKIKRTAKVIPNNDYVAHLLSLGGK